ncbi:glycosyltransferase [Actinoplanes utahensis]|uniref:Glycosyl transferase family 2 n=1 Tax=Actinoplanes utahensis TaxID=1869 RepID=A0A0A6U7Q1_ACTUT|nr:glycosyltransferase [Actinoplanes utahensis]KHD72090.1 hypothetical protein MB27_42380 [Actinoplanes utahensis]GIF28837.1 hypothetical protein Aut01nite_18230 [Actinoplanes utahensis]
MNAGPGLVLGFGTLVAGFLLYRAAELAIGGARTVAAMRHAAARPRPPVPAGEQPSVILLLPMLREDRRVAAACRHMLPVVRAGRRVSVVVVTGDRERHEREGARRALLDMDSAARPADRLAGAARAVTAEALPALRTAVLADDRQTVKQLLTEHCRPTTGELAAPLVEALNREAGWAGFHHVGLTDEGSTKVAKLNRALQQWLETSGAGRPPDYVGVYDADSLPDLSVFDQLDTVVAEHRQRGAAPPDVVQQVACYCANLRSLTGRGSLLSLADAMTQTSWALGFEYPLYRRYAAAVDRRRTRPLVYCVGHGCFVSHDFLQHIGGFPEVSPTDDLALGFIASVVGARVVPVPALDYCDIAPHPVQSMRQAAFWFSGAAGFRHVLRYARDRFGPATTRRQWVSLHLAGMVRTTAWAGQAVAWMAALALAVVSGQWVLAAVLLLAHVAYVQVAYIQTVWALYRLPGARAATGIGTVPRWRLVAGSVAASGTFLIRSLGPLASVLTGGRTLPTWKQER